MDVLEIGFHKFAYRIPSAYGFSSARASLLQHRHTLGWNKKLALCENGSGKSLKCE